jgi:hypothetical protein
VAAAQGGAGDPDDPAVVALRRAAALRSEALRGRATPPPGRPEPAGEALPEVAPCR